MKIFVGRKIILAMIAVIIGMNTFPAIGQKIMGTGNAKAGKMTGKKPVSPAQQQQKRNTPNSAASASTQNITLQGLRTLNQNQIQKLPVSVREQVKALSNLNLNSDGEVRPKDPVGGAVFDYIHNNQVCHRHKFPSESGKVYLFNSDYRFGAAPVRIAPNKDAYLAGCAFITGSGIVLYEALVMFEPLKNGANILLTLGTDSGMKEIIPLDTRTRGYYDLKTFSWSVGCLWGSCAGADWNYRLAKWNGNQYDLGAVGSGKNRY